MALEQPVMTEAHVAVCASAVLLDGGTGRRFPVLATGRHETGFVVRHEGVVHGYLNRCTHAGVELDWQRGPFLRPCRPILDVRDAWRRLQSRHGTLQGRAVQRSGPCTRSRSSRSTAPCSGCPTLRSVSHRRRRRCRSPRSESAFPSTSKFLAFMADDRLDPSLSGSDGVPRPSTAATVDPRLGGAPWSATSSSG